MREFITSEDIYRVADAGKTELHVIDEAVVTDVARETADRLGVRIITGDPVQEQDRISESVQVPGRAPRGGRRLIRLGSRSSAVGQEDGVEATVERSPFTEEEMTRYRAKFPGLQNSIHLANCSQGAQSKEVRDALEGYMENWRSSGMDWDYWVEEVNNAKAEFARFINANADDIAVVSSVSEAISSVASGIDFSGERNRVLLTEAEFPTVGHVWLAHKKYGAEVDFVPLNDGQLRLEDYDALLDDRTFLTSVTHVYYQTGYKQDLKAVADVVHRHGAYLLVDAYQSAGSCKIDVQESDVDILTTGNLKYLLGVPGIAFVYLNPEVVPQLRPAETGWFGQEDPFAFDVKNLNYARTARRLEGGTPPVTAAFAARAGMELLREVGLDRIGDHIDYLSAYCLRGALRRGLKVVSPLQVSKKGSTTSIEVPGDSHSVEMQLKSQNIVTSARGQVVRLAPHFFNTPAEIDTALDALSRILNR